MKISINQIKTCGDFQARVALDEQMVDEIAEQLKAGEQVRPITVSQSSEGIFLLDGHHRFEGAKRAGLTEIDCVHANGIKSMADAVEFGIKMNSVNGLRFSKEDIRRAIELLLKHRPDMKPEEICKVVHRGKSVVYAYLKELSSAGKIELPETREGADGKVRKTSYERREISPQVKCSYCDCKKMVAQSYLDELKTTGSTDPADWIHDPEDLSRWYCSEDCLELQKMADLEAKADAILKQAPADEEPESLEETEDDADEKAEEEETSGTYTMRRPNKAPEAPKEPSFSYPCPICGRQPRHHFFAGTHYISCKVSDEDTTTTLKPHRMEFWGETEESAVQLWNRYFRNDSKAMRRVQEGYGY